MDGHRLWFNRQVYNVSRLAVGKTNPNGRRALLVADGSGAITVLNGQGTAGNGAGPNRTGRAAPCARSSARDLAAPDSPATRAEPAELVRHGGRPAEHNLLPGWRSTPNSPAAAALAVQPAHGGYSPNRLSRSSRGGLPATARRLAPARSRRFDPHPGLRRPGDRPLQLRGRVQGWRPSKLAAGPPLVVATADGLEAWRVE